MVTVSPLRRMVSISNENSGMPMELCDHSGFQLRSFPRECKLLRAQAWQLVWVRVALLLLLGNSWFIWSMMEQLMLKESIAQCRFHVGVVAAEHRL